MHAGVHQSSDKRLGTSNKWLRNDCSTALNVPPSKEMATVYRGSVWFIKGLREYTKNGFLAAEKHFVPGALDTDISQRSFMITGANSGIGKETALALAKKGATVHMVCRNETRGNEAKTEIIETSGNQNIFLHILDMSNPCKIVEFVNGFAESGRELHVLVNNAGCMINAREVTEDGFEKNFATNTLGTFILTTQLLPVLEKSESPRVIVVSSGECASKSKNRGSLS